MELSLIAVSYELNGRNDPIISVWLVASLGEVLHKLKN